MFFNHNKEPTISLYKKRINWILLSRLLKWILSIICLVALCEILFNFSFSTLVIIDLKQSLDKYINIKVTKGNKKTLFNIPSHLVELLAQWKTIQNPEQLIFTYINTKGNVNSPLHIDYLNNKMKSVERRHPRLKHTTPHKLRHTGATLARQAGTSLEAISEALTHSDTITTKTYVNTSNVVPMAVGEIAYRNLKSNGVKSSVNFSKKVAKNTPWCEP